MRIAIFAETFLPKWDGVANTLCYYLDYLGRTGHTTLMFAPQGAPTQYAETPIKALPSLPFPFYPALKLVPPIFDVADDLQRFRPQLIHLVNPATMSWMGLHYGSKQHVPIVASYHTDIPGYAAHYKMPLLSAPLWAYFRSLHDRADLNLCPSDFTRQQLEAHGFKRVAVWSHGVDCARFAPSYRSAAWRERLTLGHPQDPLLLYVGRLAPEKRVRLLRPILDALPQARLAIVGDGPERPALEELFAGTKTVFAGYLQGQDLAAAYASADLFTFPSESETFGNVMLEALASGLPVVAPSAGGQLDFIHNGENGALFAAHDAADLVRAVRGLLERPEQMAAMGQQARTLALSQSWDAVNDQLIQEYETLLATRRHANTQRMLSLMGRYATTARTKMQVGPGYGSADRSN